MLLFLAFDPLEVVVQPVEGRVPKRFEIANLGVDRLESTRVQRIEPWRTGFAHPDEPHFTQDAEMLGCARLREAKRARHGVHGPLTS